MKGGDRVKSLDVAKGIGIVLVVVGHIHSQFHIDLQPAYRVITLFHVPLFFFISGIFYNEMTPLGSFVRKKFVRLFIPYLFINVVFWGAEAIFERLPFVQFNWHQLLLAVFGLEPVHNSLAGPSWFILVLFRICVMYKVIQIVTFNKKWIIALISVAFATVGFLSSADSLLIRQTFVALPYLCFGHIVGPLLKRENGTTHMALKLLSLVVAMLALAILSKNQNTDMAVNIYGNIPVFITGSIMGTIAVIILSQMIEAHSASFTHFLSFVGQNTMTILLWHMFFMKIVFTVFRNAIQNDIVISTVAVILSLILSCYLSQLYSIAKKRLWSR